MIISAGAKRRMAAGILSMLLASATGGGAASEPLLPSYGDGPCGVPSSAGSSPFFEGHATGEVRDERVKPYRKGVKRRGHPAFHPPLPWAIPSSPNLPDRTWDGIELNRLIEMAQRRANTA